MLRGEKERIVECAILLFACTFHSLKEVKNV